MNYIIKKYNPSDENDLFVMIKEFYNLPAVLHKIPDKNIKNTLNLLNTKSNFLDAYIIKINEEYVGYALLAFTYSNESGGDVMWVEEIYIRKAYRRNELSKALLNHILKQYPNISRIRLEMVDGNKESFALFSSFEFKKLEYIPFIKEN